MILLYQGIVLLRNMRIISGKKVTFQVPFPVWIVAALVTVNRYGKQPFEP